MPDDVAAACAAAVGAHKQLHQLLVLAVPLPLKCFKPLMQLPNTIAADTLGILVITVQIACCERLQTFSTVLKAV